MRIGIDVSMTADAKTGLPSYARSLVEAFARIDARNEYWLYPITWHSFPLNYRDAVRPKARNFKTVCGRIPQPLLHRAWSTGNRKRLLGPPPDVFLSPFHSAPERWFPRLVCVFHDVAFRAHPEFSTEANRVYCEHQFERARRLAHHLVTVSHFSKAEIVRLMGVTPNHISVIHEAADPMFRHLPGSSAPARVQAKVAGQPFLLYVGSVEPRKNLTSLIRAYAAMRKRSRHPAHLVIAGGSGWKNSEIYQSVEQLGLGDVVHFLGFVTDAELIELYNTCAAFCYPSLYEGFGLPVIEAMSCGAPVIASRVASLPEVGGPAVRYVSEPRDERELAGALEEVLTDQALQQRLRHDGMRQAARFSWDRTARETLTLLENVVADRHLDPISVQMGIDERGVDQGFYPGESDQQKGPFRWMQRRGVIRMPVRQGASTLRVTAASPVPNGEATLIASVAGTVVGTAALTQGPQEAVFTIPRNIVRGGVLPIVLEVNRTVPPSIKGGDTRDLGARIFGASVD